MGKKKSGFSRQASTANQPTSTRTPRVRKSPMERAAALIKLAAVKIGALAKLAARWPQEEGAGEQQVVVCERVAINLRSVQSMAAQLSTDVELLQASGFSPKVAASGRKGLAEGDVVKIKAAKFDVIMHGDDNNFKVVKTSEKNVLIRGVEDESVQFPVLRTWLESVKVA